MTGDIILQKRSGIIGWFVSLFTKSDWVHCSIDIDDNTLIRVDYRGRHYTDITDLWGDVIVLTPEPALLEGQESGLRRSIKHSRVRGYSLWNIFKSWIWKSTDDERRGGRYYHCAEFVCEMYRQGTGIDLVPKRSNDKTQPHHFLTSPFLRQEFAGNLTDYFEEKYQESSIRLINLAPSKNVNGMRLIGDAIET